MDWDINSQLIDIKQYLLDVTAGHSVRFLMDFTITLEEWGQRCGRDGVTLSNAIRLLLERARKDAELENRMKEIEKNF